MRELNSDDAFQREQALNPTKSFIVQAPAGSGKTELLVQRFLALLAQADRVPEEVIAITFTRKAASEMQHRIMDALDTAQHPPPSLPHAYKTWQLALSVLKRDQALGWQLLQQPSRLNIMTIDALCAHLNRYMPLLSGIGASPQITEDPQSVYMTAARHLFSHLEQAGVLSDALAALLLHLDNRLDLLETLIIGMLARRDQWLPYLLHQDLLAFRDVLESGLQNVVTEVLQACVHYLPKNCQEELLFLLRYAQEQLRITGSAHPIMEHAWDNFPTANVQDQSAWLAISRFLLTTAGQWRVAVDKRLGFPPSNSMRKQQMQSFLKTVRNHPRLQNSLQALQHLPPPVYDESQWQILSHLATILPIAVAELQITFSRQGVVDFTEMTLAALRALGDPESPSDLALRLDYQIRHILVDEFQDTSVTQLRLLEQLTIGWQPNDGRTLFLVGDPMQSIYRFRAAEVGLFLKVQESGLGDLPLIPLQLQTNFRSCPAIVNWMNQQGARLFPEQAHMASGAVTFSAAMAAQAELAMSGVYLQVMQSPTEFASQVEKTLTEHPSAQVAILVRNRQQLADIIPELKRANLAFHAIEINRLIQHPIVQDLLALTTALLQLANRTAWLAILRAPWCGLTLADLQIVAGTAYDQTILERLSRLSDLDLSVEGRIRLEKVARILQASLAQRERLPFRMWIENTWEALEGPRCLTEHIAHSAAMAYFNWLTELESSVLIWDANWLSTQLQDHYMTPDPPSDCRLHLMTIHKAKGLEFDIVMIPHLEGKSRADSEQLLLWQAQAPSDDGKGLLLAPIKPRGHKSDPIYHYLQQMEQARAQNELVRLFYVAATRAKFQLYWMAYRSVESKNYIPCKSSFLGLLWPLFEPLYTNHHTAIGLESDLPLELELESDSTISLNLERLHANYFLQVPEVACANFTSQLHWKPFKERWSDIIAKPVGTVIHLILQYFSLHPKQLTQWHTTDWLIAARNQWRRQLLEHGIPLVNLPQALEHVERAILNTLKDPFGRWLIHWSLSPERGVYTEAESELRLSSSVEEEIQHRVIDRTFIDEAQVRWLIDYKTGAPENPSEIPQYLEQAQQQHAAQLSDYVHKMQQIDPRPIQSGLFFPILQVWVACNRSAPPMEMVRKNPSPHRGRRCPQGG